MSIEEQFEIKIPKISATEKIGQLVMQIENLQAIVQVLIEKNKILQTEVESLRNPIDAVQ